jgi:hypothetical protein
MSDSAHDEAGKIPRALERSEVPHYFRQFGDASVLKKLAHSGKGPLYQLIGRKAWYDTADIVSWLEARKQQGPKRTESAAQSVKSTSTVGLRVSPPKRRGRPTKTEQWERRQAEERFKP